MPSMEKEEATIGQWVSRLMLPGAPVIAILFMRLFNLDPQRPLDGPLVFD